MLSLNITSCITPKGDKQLKAAIEADMLNKKAGSLVLEGRPQFMKVLAYPKIIEGNIYDESWIWLNVGKEKLNISDIIKR